MEKTGKVSGWQDAKGFGFVLPDDGSARVFLHHSALAPGQARPRNGDSVRFLAGTDDKGRAVAKKVWSRPQAEVTRQRVVRERAAEKVVQTQLNREKDSQAVWLVLPFLSGLAVLALLGLLPMIVVGIYLAASLLTYLAYLLDKRSAQRGERRTPENTLHMMSLLGGWPGALLAQRILRHKSTKPAFRVVFWATVVFNVLGLAFAVNKLPALLG